MAQSLEGGQCSCSLTNGSQTCCTLEPLGCFKNKQTNPSAWLPGPKTVIQLAWSGLGGWDLQCAVKVKIMNEPGAPKRLMRKVPKGHKDL